MINKKQNRTILTFVVVILMVSIFVCVDNNMITWSSKEIIGTVIAIQGASTRQGPYIRAVTIQLSSEQNIQTGGTILPIQLGSKVVVNEGVTSILNCHVYKIAGIQKE